jgi:hypothetical protein
MTKIENIKFKNIEFKVISYEDLDLIEPLWEKLKEHHQIISPHFKEKYHGTDFKTRKHEIMNKSKYGRLRVELSIDKVKERCIGYCISSISPEGEGEIDSIYMRKIIALWASDRNLLKDL